MEDHRKNPMNKEAMAAMRELAGQPVEERNKLMYGEFAQKLDLSEVRNKEALLNLQAQEAKADYAKNAEGTAFISAGQLRQWSKSDLAREVVRLNTKLNEVDMVGMVQDVQKRRAQMADVPKLQHREAFMLMTYRSEGGTHEQKIWNSRDGVTPFQVHVDGVKLVHAMAEMQGPFMDRPEGCVAQWETRTEKAMIEAWRRSLERALLAGRMSKDEANSMADSTEHARAYHMSIGLRSMVTGKFTDEA